MNKYEILQTIGEGEYGVVLKAKNKETNDLVAIKKFKQDDSDEQNKRVILRQVKILKTLNHQNIIQLKQAFRKKGRIYLVCEYVDKNLLQLMETGSITPQQLKNFAYHTLKGIAYMHSLNIIHRDIKPQNVLISKSNVVKICDLGFARNVPNNNGKMTDYVATRWYRPPELILGRDDYDKSIDVWAIACVMAEMIDGEPLFGGENDLDQLYLIQKCLGPLTPQHNQYFLKNPKFVGMKFPEIHSLETLQRRYIGKIDKQAIDLLKKMLKMDPTARISAQEALNHPFFSRSNSQSQIQFKKSNYRQLMNLEENNFSRGGHLPMNNFINDNISSRMTREDAKSLNKVIGMGKLKKNQQQTQYYQDSVPEDFGVVVTSKAKSLGKKNTAPGTSIRQKTSGRIGKKNLIKALKSSFNQVQPFRRADKFNGEHQDEHYDDQFEKQEPQTAQIFTKNTKDSKTTGLQQGNQPSQNGWNGQTLQGPQGKSKQKQKMLSNRGYARQTESPTKDEHQKLKKNLKTLKRENVSIVFNNNTYNLNVIDH